MRHVRGLFLEHVLPADVDEMAEPCSIVVLFEPLSSQDRVGLRQWDELKLWRVGKVILFQYLLHLLLLLGVLFPFNVSLPTFPLLLEMGYLALWAKWDCVWFCGRHDGK